MIEIPLWLKFSIAVAWDIFDLTIGRIPLFGSFTDFISGILAIILWGYEGIFAFWEILDVTDQVDSFVPTLTAIGVFVYLKNKGHDTEQIAGGAKIMKGGIRG